MFFKLKKKPHKKNLIAIAVLANHPQIRGFKTTIIYNHS